MKQRLQEWTQRAQFPIEAEKIGTDSTNYILLRSAITKRDRQQLKCLFHLHKQYTNCTAINEPWTTLNPHPPPPHPQQPSIFNQGFSQSTRFTLGFPSKASAQHSFSQRQKKIRHLKNACMYVFQGCISWTFWKYDKVSLVGFIIFTVKEVMVKWLCLKSLRTSGLYREPRRGSRY